MLLLFENMTYVFVKAVAAIASRIPIELLSKWEYRDRRLS